jgi:adenylate kinase family enzyme
VRLDILGVMGATNAGKSTAIDFICPPRDGTMLVERSERFPTAAAVRVGRYLRTKYGEDHFKGKAAALDLEDEVERIIDEAVTQALAWDLRVLMFDGQPRSLRQLRHFRLRYDAPTSPTRVTYLLIHASREERLRRIEKRDTTEKAKQLSLARLDGDCADLLDLLCEMNSERVPWVAFAADQGNTAERVVGFLSSHGYFTRAQGLKEALQ